MSEILEIDWLGECAICGCSELKVTTDEGSQEWLYSDDKVECSECGHQGLVDADDGVAWVDWFDIKAESKEG
jgi:hypothetical protein